MRPAEGRFHRVLILPVAVACLFLMGITAASADTHEPCRDTAPVTFRVTAPATTPPGDPVFIAGDFQGWDPGDPACQLTGVGGLVYEITLDLTTGAPIGFKFTRGSWATVEKGPNGEEIPNRTHTVTGAETLELTVANWADQPVSTITGDVTTHTVPGFLSGRRVWVYLPSGYDLRTDQRYPVLYMFDGQNLFDQVTSYAGEWGVDETCESLIPAGLMSPIIVVAVDNGGLDRIHEYTPWYDPGYGDGGGGEAHLQQFIDILMPWVDVNYRTLTGPGVTGLAGSSLGGLMSLYAAYAHPDVFGLIGALSPSIWWSDDELLDYAAGQTQPDSRVYMDMGTIESGSMVDDDGNGIDDNIDDLRAMRDVMVGQGFVPGDDLMVVEDEGGMHNEWYWAQRLPGTLQFLFPPPPETGVGALAPAELSMLHSNAPNPFRDETTLHFDLPHPADVNLTVYDIAGRRVRGLHAGQMSAGPQEVTWDGRNEHGTRVSAGVYMCRFQAGDVVEQRRMVLLR